jgi:hypothetical protein
MRGLVTMLLVVGCATDATPPARVELSFGPFSLQPGEEVSDQCVQLTLHNDKPIYVNQVELTTGPGFHHSNWFYVPEGAFFGPDGTFTCADRNFDQVAAAIDGGVLFAQSTQSPHEVQAFPPGVAIFVPGHSKLVAQIHLLDAGDTALELHPKIAVTGIPEADVTTRLAALSFEDHALALPPHTQSAFSVECDVQAKYQALLGRDPDFKLYYALAHYHVLGTGMQIEAVRPDGTADMIYQTANHVGDALGGTLEPAFDFTGHTRMRFTCDYTSDRDAIVRWGIGDQEMCVFLAFTDSPLVIGGGVAGDDPGPATVTGGVTTFDTGGCEVIAN